MTQPPSEEEPASTGQQGGRDPAAAGPNDPTPATGFPPPPAGGYGPPPTGFPPPPAGGYGPPPAGYGPPQPGDGPPQQYAQPGYGPGAQSPGFPPAPEQGQAPQQQGGYSAPQQGGYPPPPQGGYGPPQQQGGYPPPPQGGYGPPQGGFPPPQGSYGPPQGGYGPPQGGHPAQQQGGAGSPGGPSLPPIDISKVRVGDWVVLGLGALLLLFSFFGWWTSSFDFGALSQSHSLGGWNRFWWIAPLLILAVTAVRATQLLTGLLVKEIKPLWLLYAAVAAVVFYLISLIDIFSYSFFEADDLGGSYSAGPGFGIWASLVLSLGFVYFLALSLQARGEKLPVKVPGPTF